MANKTTGKKIVERSTTTSGRYKLGGAGELGTYNNETTRWWDCSSYVAYCLGYQIPVNHPFTTADEKEVLINDWDFKDVTSNVNKSDGSGMKLGDILIYVASPYGHTAIYIGNGQIRGANGSTVDATPVPNVQPVYYRNWTYCLRPPGQVYIKSWVEDEKR